MTMLGGGAGDDDLNGGFGNDVLFGENGNDVLNGSAGNDIFVGGGNDDVFVFAPGDGADTIADFFAGGPEDRIWFAGTDLHSFADVQSHADHCRWQYRDHLQWLLHRDAQRSHSRPTDGGRFHIYLSAKARIGVIGRTSADVAACRRLALFDRSRYHSDPS